MNFKSFLGYVGFRFLPDSPSDLPIEVKSIRGRIALRAAEILDEEGWVQGAFHVPDIRSLKLFKPSIPTGYCLAGALHKASAEIDPGFNSGDMILDEIVKMHHLDPDDVVRVWSGTFWNDVKGRKKEEVTAVLRLSAPKL